MDYLRQAIRANTSDKHYPIELSPQDNAYSLVSDPESATAWQGSAQGALRPSSRRLGPTALAGWAVAGILFVMLILSHSTILPEIERVDLAQLPHHAIDSLGKAAGLADVKASTNGAPDEGLNKVTIVSAFFQVESGKKHSLADYDVWLIAFLGYVELPIVFYCAPDMRDHIQELRGDKPITIITTWDSPFVMPPLEDLGGQTWAENQNRIDPEVQWHVPDVYAIWTAKPWIVKDAKDRDPYGSEYFWWFDAGSFRESVDVITFDLRKMPDVIDQLFADNDLPDDTLVVAAPAKAYEPGLEYVHSVHRGDELPETGDMVSGTYFGGKAAAIDWWFTETFRTTVLQTGLGHFAGKEQPVWTQAAALNWERIFAQNVMRHEGDDCGWNEWFRFPYIAAGRNCTVESWNGPEYARIEAAKAAAGGGAADRMAKRMRR